jgi:hypothetical protein
MASEPVEQMAAEADLARGRVAETIDALQERLDPRRLVGDAAERVQTSGRALFDRAGATVKSHPIAIGAAVAAVGVALLARQRLAGARVDLGDEFTDYTDYDDGFGFPESANAEQAAVAPAPLAAIGEPEANPLVSILLGLAAGAALGALLPTSDTERRTLGEAGGRIGRAARAAARQAAGELDAAGLGLESVRNRAGDAARKARDAARHVVDAARGELRS